jgi:hypothetical protein
MKNKTSISFIGSDLIAELDTLKKVFSTNAIGYKIPIGVIMVKALSYVVNKTNSGELKIDINKSGLTFKNIKK